MKRIIFTFIVTLAFFGCASVPKHTFDINIKSEKNNIPLFVQAKAIDFGASLVSSGGTGGFQVGIKNNADNVVRIVWAKSSVNYNGNSYVPFIDGQKYITASMPMSPTVIPAGGAIVKQVYSSAQVTPVGRTWTMKPIESDVVTIILCAESGDIEDYYVISTIKRYE